MDQVTAFSPPVVCKLLDGSFIRFARADMNMWAAIGAELNAARIAPTLAEIDSNAAIKPVEKPLAKRMVMDSVIPTLSVMRLCTQSAEHATILLMASAKRAGHTAEEITAKLMMIPPQDQFTVAEIVAMLPVVKNPKQGTESDPFTPGADLTSVATTGESASSSSDATDSTPAV